MAQQVEKLLTVMREIIFRELLLWKTIGTEKLNQNLRKKKHTHTVNFSCKWQAKVTCHHVLQDFRGFSHTLSISHCIHFQLQYYFSTVHFNIRFHSGWHVCVCVFVPTNLQKKSFSISISFSHPPNNFKYSIIN